jgi:DNA-binding CsgD family transcriptional regulator
MATSTPAPHLGSPPDLGFLLQPCGCPRLELTDREGAVLEQLAEGVSSRHAARRLYVSHQTVTYHVGNLLSKFQCANRTGVVARAYVLGILLPTWPPRLAPAPHPPSAAAECPHRVKEFRPRRTFLRT